MKADRKKAASIGYALVQYKDALARQHIEVLDATKLRAILNDTSDDTLAAEQELIMAWRLYTQEREQQIVAGEFRAFSSPEEVEEGIQFSRSEKITFDPSNLKGIEYIASEIEKAINKDILMDSIKWQAVEMEDEKLRNEYGEQNLKLMKSKCEDRVNKYKRNSISMTIRRMLDEHRNFWAQRPTEPYDDIGLINIFEYFIGGQNCGLDELLQGWHNYLETRITNLHSGRELPFHGCTDDEKASANEDRRRLAIEWPRANQKVREMFESQIKALISEDIISDTIKWERHKKEEEALKKRVQEFRLERIQKHRDAFISKIKSMYGHEILELISNEDIDHYSSSAADFENEDELWYSILMKYDFDQNTNSCLYFIRQSTAIKIGITALVSQRWFLRAA